MQFQKRQVNFLCKVRQGKAIPGKSSQFFGKAGQFNARIFQKRQVNAKQFQERQVHFFSQGKAITERQVNFLARQAKAISRRAS